jgi:hypothetical protein
MFAAQPHLVLQFLHSLRHDLFAPLGLVVGTMLLTGKAVGDEYQLVNPELLRARKC